MPQSTSRVGKRGAVVIPAALRRRFGIEEGPLIIAEDREEGILIPPAAAVLLEIYTPGEEGGVFALQRRGRRGLRPRQSARQRRGP